MRCWTSEKPNHPGWRRWQEEAACGLAERIECNTSLTALVLDGNPVGKVTRLCSSVSVSRVCVYLRASHYLQPVSKARRFPLYSRVEAEAGRVRGSDEGCVHRAYACVCVCVSGN